MTLISIKFQNDSKAENKLIDLSSPKIMGILNITPDSFFAKSRYNADIDLLIEKAAEMLKQGATFIDIGGYSTRPNAAEVSTNEEIDRVVPAIEAIVKNLPDAILSIDTFRSKVAQAAIHAGAAIINDIAGGNLDEFMFKTVAELNVPYILMHSRGNPQTMSSLNQYDNLTLEIIHELNEKVLQLRLLGVKDIIIDPGFGFAKDSKQGFELMKNLKTFDVMNMPILVGISRKSMIWRTLGVSADDALNGTTALNMYALTQGAKILRVHDVKEANETLKLYEELC
ncbi:dihydropteroate synthase [Emticicia oligotrophica DSM 17448]|uniref:dihydropteroate synthase n=1 Tax=Emticicia oligotrophica (strain DSM 17448 / CIP 109782 / MTCC 6937 / GPTSA100-15) TaxID=929562 RepID=A0ABN4AT28_EMTOG|nr:dihydropteroate synthase [Emticicia oligotrophica]AFK04998.1 dihydropteroate synthase [Emticicia oligotrophica DSM 17448]